MNERQERARRQGEVCLHHNVQMERSNTSYELVCPMGCRRSKAEDNMLLGRLRHLWWIKPCKRVWSMD